VADVSIGSARLAVRRLHIPPLQLDRLAEVANVIVGLPQDIGCLDLRGAMTKHGRELQGLPARRHGAAAVSRLTVYLAYPGQRLDQP
jgi:hypothetical protein